MPALARPPACRGGACRQAQCRQGHPGWRHADRWVKGPAGPSTHTAELEQIAVGVEQRTFTHAPWFVFDTPQPRNALRRQLGSRQRGVQRIHVLQPNVTPRIARLRLQVGVRKEVLRNRPARQDGAAVTDQRPVDTQPLVEGDGGRQRPAGQRGDGDGVTVPGRGLSGETGWSACPRPACGGTRQRHGDVAGDAPGQHRPGRRSPSQSAWPCPG